MQTETALHQLQLHANALENSSSNTDNAVSIEKNLRQAAETAAARTTESLEVFKLNNKTLTSKLQASSAEINKGNEVISKLSNEYRSNKQKLKMKSELLRNQEVVMSERENTITTITRRNEHLQAEVDRLQSSLVNKTAEHEDVASKLAESAKLLDSNQQVITWLNREINEAQLGKVGSYGGGGISAATQRTATKFEPSFSPDLKVARGLGAYVSPATEGGTAFGV